jgi:hypothetical protein
MQAMGRADESNREDLFNICSYVYNHLPLACHGSHERVKKWLSERARLDAARTSELEGRSGCNDY